MWRSYNGVNCAYKGRLNKECSIFRGIILGLENRHHTGIVTDDFVSILFIFLISLMFKGESFKIGERMTNDTFFQLQDKPFKIGEAYKALKTCPKWSQIHHIGHPARNVARKSNFNDSPGNSTNTDPETPTSDTPNIIIPDDSINVDAPLYSCGDVRSNGKKKIQGKRSGKVKYWFLGEEDA
ncbi:hypothetical protein GIB67_040602 [Kingdonia uniflora]|uniref:Uncharacterized protein n=1 Tax=Kingdonia uniflora TaxID=39325 RepID=A0A7J7M8W8_9MAGN|nr:hypothetical protein GIB67_040602 [Kingdonia uniflora]